MLKRYHSATADSSAFNSGGKISVNGVVITVPRNLQVQFPAAFIPFVQVTSGSYTSNEVTVRDHWFFLSLRDDTS